MLEYLKQYFLQLSSAYMIFLSFTDTFWDIGMHWTIIFAPLILAAFAVGFLLFIVFVSSATEKMLETRK